MSRMELEHCFEQLHKKLADEARGKKTEETFEFKVAEMALFILRNFIMDTKRIADAMERAYPEVIQEPEVPAGYVPKGND